MYRLTDRRSVRRTIRRRIRGKISGTQERPRLAVFRSLRHMAVQAVDDTSGRTLAAASTLDPACRSRVASNGGTVEAAKVVGEVVAERLKEKGIEAVVFDRGGYAYHGRVRAVAEAAREAGLKF
jgi:large subunit ribosomal protein L18